MEFTTVTYAEVEMINFNWILQSFDFIIHTMYLKGLFLYT